VLAYMPHHRANFASDGSLARTQDGYPVDQVHEIPPGMYPRGPSIHYELARRLGVPALNLRVGGDHGEHARDFYTSQNSQGETIIQRDPGQPNPRLAFDALFGAVTPGDRELTPRERLRAKRGSVLDAVLSGFNRVIGAAGQVDRMRLERHADHIRQIEREIDRTAQIVCENPTLVLPDGTPRSFVDDSGRMDDLITAAQFEVIGTAFACQATPIAHLHFSNIQDNKFPYLNGGRDLFETGDADVNWHGAVHHEDGNASAQVARRLTAMRWYARLLADLIGRLSALPEGDGSVMDSTLIVWISSLRYQSHGTDNLPCVLAGDLGGRLTAGRLHDYRNHGTGGTLGDLWTSIGNIILLDDLRQGWANAPLGTFGWNRGTFGNGRNYQNGPLPGLLAGAL
jgi:hypothetical protein